MLAEDVDITLENLLELALGTPEIGAVNFNFLYEVISEIIKHLGRFFNRFIFAVPYVKKDYIINFDQASLELCIMVEVTK